MGSACIMRPGFWPSFRNQSLLAFNTTYSIGFSYENRFSIRELGTSTAAIAIPAGRSSLGLSYSNFGYSGFRRSMAGAACGLKIAENVAAGVQADFFHERSAADLTSFSAVTFEAGIYYQPSETVSTGIHIFNPVPNSLRKTMMPSTIRAGAGIQLSRVIFAAAEAEMSTGEKLKVRTGFEYEISGNFRLRGGFCTENTSFSFGLGYLVRSVKIDLSFVTHETLGITSGASLIFILK